MTTLTLNGQRKSGQEVRDENTNSAITMANIVKNSLGPAGLDKMIVDEVGELNITNDGATILKLMEVKHPAAKIFVELANLQDKEIGDGTTSVVLIAAELLKRGNALTKQSIHPTTVISGFQQAKKAACKFLADNLAYKVDALPKDALINAAKTAMSSKVIGQAADHFSALAVEAMQNIARPINSSGFLEKKSKMGYDVKSLGVLKIRGDSLTDSRLIEGVALPRSRSLRSFGMRTFVKDAKIAFIDFDLRREKLPFNVKVVCENPENLEDIRNEEVAGVERRVALVMDSGANALFCSHAVDEFVMEVVSKRGAIALKSVPRAELKRVAAATGGRVLTSLATFDSKDFSEQMDGSALGKAAEIYEESFGDVGQVVVVRTNAQKRAQTVILRGPSDYALDEIERSLHDVFCALKRILESNRVVVGGGVVEAALSAYLDSFAETIGSREQIAISEFAAALLVIPKTLASNGAHQATSLTAKLHAAHVRFIRNGEEKLRNVGLNLETGSLRDNLKSGVLEPAMSKVKSIKFATEAAIALLRIDDAVEAAPKPEKPPRR